MIVYEKPAVVGIQFDESQVNSYDHYNSSLDQILLNLVRY